MNTELTQATVRELLDYNPETGTLKWRARGQGWFRSESRRKWWNTCYSGCDAGQVRLDGYVLLSIFNQRYFAHRVIWLWMTGAWPTEHIDHVNHLPGDNRWRNLRAASRQENMRNQSLSKSNASGVVGVGWSRHDGKWRARLKVGGRDIHLGLFADKASAIHARKAAEREFGFHENHGNFRSAS